MADGTSENTGHVSVSGGAAKWLASRAAESDLDPDEFLTRLVAAFRTVEGSGEVSFATESDVDELERGLEAVQQDIDTFRAEADEDREAVRERVLSVAEAVDEKAPADHDHPDIRERLQQTTNAVQSVEADVQAVDEEVDDLREWAEEGFENYEDVLDYLTDRTDDMETRTETLARVLVDVRQSVRRLAAAEEKRAAAAKLKHMANEQGVREAACEECGNEVDVALLTSATCPFCQRTFSAVESGRRFGVFRSATLTTGERPALEAPEVEQSLDDELEELVENE